MLRAFSLAHRNLVRVAVGDLVELPDRQSDAEAADLAEGERGEEICAGGRNSDGPTRKIQLTKENYARETRSSENIMLKQRSIIQPIHKIN